MSESIPTDPKTGMPLIGAADYADSQKKALLDVMSTPNAALSIPATLAYRDPQATGGRQWIPGAGLGESMAGMGAYINNNIAALLNPAGRALSSKWENLPNAPQWMSDAGRRFEENRADWKTSLEDWSGGVLRQPDMTQPSGQVADIVGSAIGMGAGITPASWVEALPRAAQIPASLALMSRGHAATNIPINLGMSAAQEGVEQAFHPEQTPETMGPAKTSLPPAAQTATPPALSTVVAPVPQPVPDNVSTFDSYMQQRQKAQGGEGPKIVLPFGEGELAGPTFTQQGDSSTGVAEALAGLAIGFAGIAAGRAAYRRGGVVSAAGRETRINAPDHAEAVNDYHNDLIKRGPGPAVPEDIPPPMPTSGNVVRKAVVYTADKLGNDAARDQELIRLMTDNPTTGEKMASELGNLHDTSMQHNQMLNFLETGHDIATRTSIPSHTALDERFAALPADAKDTWSLGMMSDSELQQRENRAAAYEQRFPGKTPDIADIRHDQIGKTNEDLRRQVEAMEADPAQVILRDQYRDYLKGLHDLGGNPAYGFYQPSELAEMDRLRSKMVPQFTSGDKLIHPLDPQPKNAYTGKASGGINPITALAAYAEQLYPLYKQNKFATDYYNLGRNYMAQPGTAQFMTDVNAPHGPHTSYYPEQMGKLSGDPRDPIVVLRTPEGVKHVRVDDPQSRRIMTGESLAGRRVALDTGDVLRRLYQKGTTAVASLWTGRAMPLRNLLYTTVWSPVTAPYGSRTGLGTLATQSALGTRAPRLARALDPIARGVDMVTNPLVVPASGIIAPAERMVQRFADLMHPSADNIANQKLRALVGDAPVDAAQQFAQNWWDTSTTKWAAERGLMGQSSPIRIDAPGVRTGTTTGIMGRDVSGGIRLESARLTPKAYVDGGWMGTGKAGFIRVHNVLGEAFNGLGDVGHDMWIRLNKNNPHFDPDTLAYEARNLVGNPTRAGSSVAMGKLSSWLPYTNVSVQGLGRTMRAVGEHPVATPVTIATGLGTMALVSILTHMRSAAHMDALQNNLSLQQRAANVSLALNDDPDKPTMIPLPQEARAAYAFMLDIVSKIVNITAARHDPDVFNAVWDGITHFLGSNITRSNLGAIKHGGIDAFDFINAPQLMGRIDWNALSQGKSFSDSFHSIVSGGKQQPAGGQGYDAPLDSHNGQLFEDMLSNVFGAAAHSLMDTGNAAVRYQHQGHGFLESLGMAGRDWMQGSRESNMELNNVVWETKIRESLNPPIAEALQPTLYALQQIPKSVQPGMEGYVGKGSQQLPVPMTLDKPMTNDLLMHQMLRTAQQYEGWVRKAMVPINNLRTQMKGVDKVGMDPSKRRAWMNDATRDIADKYKLVSQYVNDMDNSLSNMSGKAIRLEDIDWTKDSSQFR